MLCVLSVDQLSKWWIINVVMRPPRVIPITDFFNLVLAWNTGISFGLFDSDSLFNVWALSVLALLIVACLIYWLLRAERRIIALSLGLIIGGALGNVADRLRIGAVVDFLDFHAMGWHWPAFNVADSSITVGAVILIVDSLFESANHRKTSAEEQEKNR
ncbi:MAG: signal peptidase II [Hyphomicrobiales bacterium]|nr:signal peptidase II [Hyphomicrobiales bacterium]